MPYGLPEEEPMPMGDEEEMAPESDDPELAQLAAEAFPGVEVNASALKALISHCMGSYDGAEEEEMPDEKGKSALLLAFGKPKGT